MPTNRLAREKSPYLLQHAQNPVDWYPWGGEAFDKARAEDKPVFLSVGYSTCHWCHVMERESFENEAIAAILNRDFVSIKVDREERPDLDRIYMLFVQATSGGGGWPMSVWLTPDRKPFFGGTYFPPDSRYGRPGFPYILEQIAGAWKTRRTELVTSGDSIVEQLRSHAEVTRSASRADVSSADPCFHYFRRIFDTRFGGFGGAPKFPRPAVFHFLFRYHHRTGSAEALDMSLHTLREMAKGGMNDQLGGGFHRYSVDERWFVPHFEKMLYDQAQLAVAYLEAFQITRDELFAKVARDIFEYVLRDMTHPEGGFFSAEDADSIIDAGNPHEKGEGAFFIWSHNEIITLLGEKTAEWFNYRYGVDDEGNVRNDPHGEFSGRNILFEANSVADTARRFAVPVEEMTAALDEAKRTLLAARAKRPRPGLDDKILAGWNGLMISAFAKGGLVLNEPRYAAAAERASQFVLNHLQGGGPGTLQRRWRDGEASINGFLDDYALFIQGLLDLYEGTLDSSWLQHAVAFTATMLDRFEDKDQGGFFSTAEGAADLVLRMKEDYDGAEPSGNSVAAMNLLRLAAYTGNDDLREAATDLFAAFATRINQQPVTIPLMLSALIYAEDGKGQVVLAGDASRFMPSLGLAFRPNSITLAVDGRTASWRPELKAMTPVNGAPAAYVCEDFTCQLPVTTAEQLAYLLDRE